MEHLFADYEVSTLVKDKGFDANCLAVYMNGEFQIPRGFSMAIVTKTQVDLLKGKAILAPLWDQLIEWLREVHQIDVNVFAVVTHIETTPIQWCAWVVDIKKLISNNLTENTEFYFDDYDETRRTAILHALTLI
jgi:hypothetical protein